MKKIKFIVLGVLTLCLSLIGVAQVSAAEEVESSERESQFYIEIISPADTEGNVFTFELTSYNVSGIFLNDNSNTSFDLEFGYDPDNAFIQIYNIEEVLIQLYLDNVDISKATLVFDFETGEHAPEFQIELNYIASFNDYGIDMQTGITINTYLVENEGLKLDTDNLEYPGTTVIYQEAPLILIFKEYGDNMNNRYLEEVYVSLYFGGEHVFPITDYEELDDYDPGLAFAIKYDSFLSHLKYIIDYKNIEEYEFDIYVSLPSAYTDAPYYIYEHTKDERGRIKLKDMLYFNENNDLCINNIIKLELDSSDSTDIIEDGNYFLDDESVSYATFYLNEENDAHEYILFTAEEVAEMTPAPDTQAPKIYGTNEYTVSTKTQYSIDTIKGALFAEDNSGEEVEIKLFSDYYSENYQTPGTYYVTFFATDSSGNTTTYPVKINVKDTQAPVFYDKNGKEVTSTTVYKSLDSVLLISEVMAKMTVTDDVDGEIKTVSIIKDNYTGYGDEAGTYTIVVRAKDAAGNKTDFVIYVYVLDSMPDKTLIIDKHHIVVENNVKLTDDNIAAILKTCGYYKTNTTSYVTINSEAYTELYDTNGEYLVEYNIVTTSGTEINGVLTVEVVDARAGDNTIVEEEPNIFMKVLNWIWNLIKKIFTFIADLFSGKLFK